MCDDARECRPRAHDNVTYRSLEYGNFYLDMRSGQFPTNGKNGAYLSNPNGQNLGLWCKGEDQKFLGSPL